MKKFSYVVANGGSYGAGPINNRKPVFRSSAIFPVISDTDFHSSVLFMGYWIIKRKIKEVGLLVTLRDNTGAIILRQTKIVDSPRSFEISLLDLLGQIDYKQTFIGSIELEISSARDLVFPYPAFVLVYHGDNFKTCVHTTGRIYNDIEDNKDSIDYAVAETGFDIYSGVGVRPFVSFVNGPLENREPITLQIFNSKGEFKEKTLDLDPLQPYETVVLDFSNHFEDMDEFLKGDSGYAKIHNQLKGFFTRMIAGNLCDVGASITHTYYDCCTTNDADSYWTREDESFFDSSVQVPVFADLNRFTELILYPIFSPTNFTVNIDIYDEQGQLLVRNNRVAEVMEGDPVKKINLSRLIPSEFSSLKSPFSAFITLDWAAGQKIPARLKFGLNVGINGQQGFRSCNICFGPKHGIVRVNEKKGTRKWAPILSADEGVVVICNSSNLKKHARECRASVIFTRIQDDQEMKREFVIPPFGQLLIDKMSVPEIHSFLGGLSGWVYVELDNPVADAWYFNFSRSGIIAGDHAF